MSDVLEDPAGEIGHKMSAALTAGIGGSRLAFELSRRMGKASAGARVERTDTVRQWAATGEEQWKERARVVNPDLVDAYDRARAQGYDSDGAFTRAAQEMRDREVIDQFGDAQQRRSTATTSNDADQPEARRTDPASDSQRQGESITGLLDRANNKASRPQAQGTATAGNTKKTNTYEKIVKDADGAFDTAHEQARERGVSPSDARTAGRAAWEASFDEATGRRPSTSIDASTNANPSAARTASPVAAGGTATAGYGDPSQPPQQPPTATFTHKFTTKGPRK